MQSLGAKFIRQLMPWGLLSIRVILSPILVFACKELNDREALWMYLIAFITDYFDGVLARFLGTATAALRKADSAADTVFHIALTWFIFNHHAEVIGENRIALTLYGITAAAWYTLDAIRWRRVAGFHACSAKLFSILLLIWIVRLLLGRQTGHELSWLLIFGSASNLEGLCISLKLQNDRTDVPTFYHAFR
jgi:CDP-diacylglycerol--glycerol-3-phosphate 3-phosphatidyltransferase